MLENAATVEHDLTCLQPGLAAGGQVLQSLVWPDLTVHPDAALSLKMGAGVTLSTTPQAVQFEAGGVLALDTAYNLFSWIRWRDECAIASLALNLRGAGHFVLEVVAERPRSRDVICCDLALVAGKVVGVDLTGWLTGRDDSVLTLNIRAIGAGHIAAVDWVTNQAPRRKPRLLMCVTTFRREQAATDTALRLDAALTGHSLADDLHLLIVDNGRSLTLPPLTHVTLVGNRNLGGAGGFARGLDEAVARGYSHCLFMDDDASVDLASITRTWTFLAHVTDPSVAISGTMTRADEPTIVWENSAFFTGHCRCLFADMNLSDTDDLCAVEFASRQPRLPNIYGAFWYFAFPVASVRHWPFPFFVRGDDVNFSIVNPFRILTLPGVICYQELDFADKDTSLAQYLSLRCDLLQVLLLPYMPHRFLWALKVPCVFFMRMLVLLRVESLHALNLAIEDVLRGPAYFAANADVATRRAELSALRLREIWLPVKGPLPAEKRPIDPDVSWQRFLMKYSLNGLLLPFFGLWGNQIILARNHRKLVRNCWGAAQVTYVSPDGGQAMTLRHAKLETWREGLRMTRNVLRLASGYPRLRKTWLAGFPHLTSAAFWRDQFRADVPR